jgi:hypothetical protein
MGLAAELFLIIQEDNSSSVICKECLFCVLF